MKTFRNTKNAGIEENKRNERNTGGEGYTRETKDTGSTNDTKGTVNRMVQRLRLMALCALCFCFSLPAQAAETEEDWPMLLPGSGWYYFDVAKTYIRSIEFVDSYEPDGSEIAVKKVDNDCKGEIKAYLLAGRDRIIVAGNGSGGIYANEDSGGMFADFKIVEEIKLGVLNTSRTVQMDYMFKDCCSIETLDLTNMDTSAVTDMLGMFKNCYSLINLDLQYLDLSKVRDASYMFCNCAKIDNLQFHLIKENSLQDISYMFSNCYELRNLDITRMDFSNVIYMRGVFKNCVELETIDFGLLNPCKATDYSGLFMGCSKLKTLNLSYWDTGKAKKFNELFSGCSLLSELEIRWDTSSLVSAEYMFCDCVSLKSVNLNGFTGEHIQMVEGIFSGCVGLEELDLSNMNLESVVSTTQGNLFGDTVYPNLISFQPPCGVKIAMSMPDTGKGHFYYNGEEMTTFPRNTEEKLTLSVTHHVCFKDPEEGTVYKESTVERGESVSKPDDPTRESGEYEYTFAGWVEENGTVYEESPVYSDLTYCAAWDKVKKKAPEPETQEETEPQGEPETPEETEPQGESAAQEETESQSESTEPETSEEIMPREETKITEETTEPAGSETGSAATANTSSNSSQQNSSGGSSSGGSSSGGSSGSGSGRSYSSGGGASPSGIKLTVAGASPTFSAFWYADASGTWRVKRKDGSIVRSAWLCDDAVAANGKEVWYLINTDGTMLISGLVQDNTGNFYSLETNHNGYYGMLRYKNGFYSCGSDTLYITFNHQHNGSFGAITNQAALEALKKKYGVTRFLIGNENCVFTSSF